MKVLETKLFWKDVKKLPDNMTKKLVVLHEQFKSADHLQDIECIKLKNTDDLFRCKLGAYRLIFSYTDNDVTFLRVLSRKDVYDQLFKK